MICPKLSKRFKFSLRLKSLVNSQPEAIQMLNEIIICPKLAALVRLNIQIMNDMNHDVHSLTKLRNILQYTILQYITFT